MLVQEALIQDHDTNTSTLAGTAVTMIFLAEDLMKFRR